MSIPEEQIQRMPGSARGNNSRLSASIVDVSALNQGIRESMFLLYGSYYEATSRSLFFADLSKKERVILLHDQNGVLRGFSTLLYFDHQVDGRPCRIIFSGDTIIHHEYWGEQTLAFTWIRLAGQMKAGNPEMPLYWMLISKGHRTYRYLQAFSSNYYPNWRSPTPDKLQALMDSLGEAIFSSHYSRRTGIVHFPESRGQLREAWSTLDERTAGRPEVAFFLKRNPGFRQGDELLCLTELSEENLRPIARRLFSEALGQ